MDGGPRARICESLEPLVELLRATEKVAVASSIIPLDVHGVADVVRLVDLLDDGEVERLIAALGPRNLELARDRVAGAIMMLVTPGHTAWAREIIGPGATLVVHQLVVLDTEVEQARQTLRGTLRFLLGVEGYAANMPRMGFGDDEIADLSDGLVDAVATTGDADAIIAAARAVAAGQADGRRWVQCAAVIGSAGCAQERSAGPFRRGGRRPGPVFRGGR